MSLKAKLLTSLVAIALAIAFFVGGVVAATQTSVKFGGTVTFEATDVHATVTYDGTHTVTFNHGTTTENANVEWTIPELALTEQADGSYQGTYTFTILNHSRDRAINVSFDYGDNASATDDKVGVSITGSAKLDANTDGTDTATTYTVTITMSSTHAGNLDASATRTASYNYTVRLASATE